MKRWITRGHANSSACRDRAGWLDRLMAGDTATAQAVAAHLAAGCHVPTVVRRVARPPSSARGPRAAAAGSQGTRWPIRTEGSGGASSRAGPRRLGGDASRRSGRPEPVAVPVAARTAVARAGHRFRRHRRRGGRCRSWPPRSSSARESTSSWRRRPRPSPRSRSRRPRPSTSPQPDAQRVALTG
jgi:hypothetical protein